MHRIEAEVLRRLVGSGARESSTSPITAGDELRRMLVRRGLRPINHCKQVGSRTCA